MAIKWDKFTVKSQEAIQGAQGLAAENGNPEVLPLHLMAALLEDKEGVVLPVLEKLGVPVQQMLAQVNEAIAKLPKVQGSAAQPGLGNALSKVLDQAFKEADNFKDDYVSTEHLLLALSSQKNEPVQLALAAQESAIHEVVAFDSCDRQRELVFAPFLDVIDVAVEKAAGCLPHGPGASRGQCDALIRAGQALVIGAQKIVALIERDRVAVGFPGIRKNFRGAVLIEPADFRIAQQENSAQYDFADAFRMRFRVGQSQRAAP